MLITSGVTKVLLEARAVRFLDNFSSRRHGTGLPGCELWGPVHVPPSTLGFPLCSLLPAPDQPSGPAQSGKLSLEAKENALPVFAAALQSYQEAAAAGIFLCRVYHFGGLPASTASCGSPRLLCDILPGCAVSNFYIPVSGVTKHKIHSSSADCR
ncbi:hypothetical protein STEG23_009508 [Scotinomys teguina]